jgi:BlaI family penicillinase repressor
MEAKLDRTELQVMDEFWKHGRLSIREIQESFPKKGRPPYTSIQTIVYRLEEKGAVRRVRKIGNAHIFEAVLSREEVRGRLIDDFVGLFGGRTQTVMAHLVESGRLTRDDIRETEKLIADLEKRKDDKP